METAPRGTRAIARPADASAVRNRAAKAKPAQGKAKAAARVSVASAAAPAAVGRKAPEAAVVAIVAHRGATRGTPTYRRSSR